MKIHNITQGTAEWQALRAQHFTASEAPAMMGDSPYETRGALLRRKATGIAPEVDPATQRRFDAGHQAEAALRPVAEAMIGDELFPATVTAEIDGLPLLASMDGLTMDGTTGWENKLHNADTIAHIEQHGEPPMRHVWQLEHQLLVSGSQRILFTCGDGTEPPAHCWYESKPERRAQLIAGWKQFAADLAAYVPEAPAAPATTGRAPESLPALRMDVQGQVVASNLTEWREHALGVIRSINRDLKDDQDFADAEKAVKWCSDAEARLKAAKDHALSQAADIDRLFRAVDEVAAELRNTRLELNKLIKARKNAIRQEIAQEALARLREQVRRESHGLGEYAPALPADASLRIAEAMKGKKTVQSLRDAADGARAALAAELSARIGRRAANLATVRQIEAETGFGDLWRYDLATLLDSEPAQLGDVLRGRIAAHKQAEDLRRAREAEAASKASETTKAPPVVHTPSAPEGAVAVVRLGQINTLIAPLSISADGLASIGFEPVGKEGAAKLYRASDLPAICQALIDVLRIACGRDGSISKETSHD
jgi:predicted phage-related endonuclease